MPEPREPKQIRPTTLADYLDVMSKAVFQTGLSWEMVERKWPQIREAFHDFDPARVATTSGKEMAALQKDPRVIRHAQKLNAVVHNARTMLELEAEHGTFRKYLRAAPDFDARVADLRRRFKFLGETGCYYFLYVVREPVPQYDEWCASRGVAPMRA